MSSINPYLAFPVLKEGISVEFVNFFKECGNELFNKNQYSKAIQEYTQGIECFKQNDPNQEADESLRSLLAYFYSNRSASYVNMGRLMDGIRDASMCINIKPDWLKGYYRRAESLFMMKEYRLAALDYQKAFELDNQKSDTILRKLGYCQSKNKEFDQKLLVHQISAETDICKKGFNPFQNLVFTYASNLNNLKTRTNAKLYLYSGRFSIKGMCCN
jgi:stress-induced-phosphoprotein 1